MDNLIALSQEYFHECEAHHKDFFKTDVLKDAHITSYFSSFCGQARLKAFIALDGKRIVGYITVYIKDQADYWQIKEVGEISGLMVQEEYRHRGIAKLLLAKSREFFEAHAPKYYTVYTAVKNQTAISFYENNGLLPLYTTIIGETKDILYS